MRSHFGRSTIRIAAVAASTLLAGLYIYDRAGGDLFGVRNVQSPPRAKAETPSRSADDAHSNNGENATVLVPNASGNLRPTPTWHVGSTVLPDSSPLVQQGTNASGSQTSAPASPNAPVLPPLQFEARSPSQRQVLPGSKSGVVAVPWFEDQR